MKKNLFLLFVVALVGCFCLTGCQKDEENETPVFETDDYPMLGPDANIMAGITVPMDPIAIDRPQGANSFAIAGLAKFVATNVGSGMLSFVGGKVGEYLLSIVDPSSNTDRVLKETLFSLSAKVDTIQMQLSTITNQLNDICEQLRDVDATVVEIQNILMAKVYLDYRRDLIAINNLNKEYFEEVEGALYDSTRLAQVLDAWASEIVNGNPARLAAKNMADLLVEGSMSSADPCRIYDMITFNTLPWEAQGYDLRDEFRAADALIIVRGLQLSYMYYLLHGQKSMAEDVAKTVNNLAQYYENHSVVRSDDVAICQIRGAHVVLDKNITDITSFKLKTPAYINGKQMVAAHAYGMDIDVPTENQINQYAQQLLSSKELNAIVSLYKALGKNNQTLLSILRDEAGIEAPSIANIESVFMPLQESDATCQDEMVGSIPFTSVKYSGLVNLKQTIVHRVLDWGTFEYVDRLLEPESRNVIVKTLHELDTKDKYNGWTTQSYQMGSYKRWMVPGDNMSYDFVTYGGFFGGTQESGKLLWLKVNSRF